MSVVITHSGPDSTLITKWSFKGTSRNTETRWKIIEIPTTLIKESKHVMRDF